MRGDGGMREGGGSVGDRSDEARVTRHGVGREGEGRCGSHPGRQRKLDLEIRLRLLIIVRHAAGRYKREIDRSSAPLLDCGAADRISVAITNTPEAGLQARAALRARRQAGRAPGGPPDAVGGAGHNSKPA